MLKRLFFLLCVSFCFTRAEVVNALAASVEGEAITTLEIARLASQLSISREAALNLLIKERLKDAEIKRLGIVVSPLEVNRRLAQIAQQNGLSPAQFRNTLANRGISTTELSSQIRSNLIQEKLYEYISANSGRSISQSAVLEYYQKHIDEFETFKSAELIKLSSKDINALEAKIAKPLSQVAGVKEEKLSLNSLDMPQDFLALITHTEQGSHTPISFKNGVYESYYILDKTGQAKLPFESVKQLIERQIYASRQNEIVNDYFDKLLARSKVNIIR